MQTDFSLQRVAASGERYAEAQLLAIEGNWLIARAAADGIRGLRRCVIHKLAGRYRRQRSI